MEAQPEGICIFFLSWDYVGAHRNGLNGQHWDINPNLSWEFVDYLSVGNSSRQIQDEYGSKKVWTPNRKLRFKRAKVALF